MADITRAAKFARLRAELDAAWLARTFDEARVWWICEELRRMIGDDEKPRTAPARPPASKQALRDMIAEAFARTEGAVRVTRVEPAQTAAPTSPQAQNAEVAPPREAMGQLSDSPDEPPSAYQVAVAIVAASRELSADPASVATGVAGRGGRYADHSVPRARAYAAYAIRHCFPQNGSTAIGRWVGARLAGSYMSVIDAQRRGGQIRWWDEAVFRRVVAEVEKVTRADERGGGSSERERSAGDGSAP